MKIKSLIAQLLFLQAKYGEDTEALLMQEFVIKKGEYPETTEMQVTSKVEDVAYSVREGIVIIGKEL